MLNEIERLREISRAVHEMNSNLKTMPATRPILLNNKNCPYCGKTIDASEKTKEHVIGRRFVPKGKLKGSWNLIVWTCSSCNNQKAELENDISAITMQPDAWGKHVENDPALFSESLRKGHNSISRKTQKPVKDSSEEVKIAIQLAPNIEMTFTMITPPQIGWQRMYDLARLHLMGFFFLLTYDYTNQTGGFWKGHFMPLHEALRSDWGNEVHRGFMDAINAWPVRIIADAADGYFKIMIRRHRSAELWSWALEWNMKLRLVGFFGDKEAVSEVLKLIPAPKMHDLPQGQGRLRHEIPLNEDEDTLFFVSDDSDRNIDSAMGFVK